MNVISLFYFAASVVGLRLQTSTRVKSQLSLSLPYSLDSARPLTIPQGDLEGRYCHSDPDHTMNLRVHSGSLMEYGGDEEEGVEPVLRETLLYGHCDADSDCQAAGSRPFCIENACRECREGSEFEDCGTSAAKCGEETEYTCSECVEDDDCKRGKFCRLTYSKSVFLNKGVVARRTCVACENVPDFGEVTNPTTCSWRCPINEYFLMEDDVAACKDCPVCGHAQFYAPSHSPTSFYSTCTNGTEVVCANCASIGVPVEDENFCATLMSPDILHTEDMAVGDLGEAFPCRFFQCKASWFLDLSVNKCNKCHYSMCALGQRLEGCGGLSPGACVGCAKPKPKTGVWTGPNCQFLCPSGNVFDGTDCVKCDPGAEEGTDHACREGMLYGRNPED